MKPLDYSRSFLIGSSGNRVRFPYDSRTRVFHPDGTSEDFIWAPPCKAEHTFGAGDLFAPDNYDGSRIYGPNRIVWFRKKSSVRERVNERTRSWRTLYPADWAWGGMIHHSVEAQTPQELTTNDEVLQATYDWLPLIAQTEIWNDDTGLRAIIEYPVKTMNTISSSDLERMRSDKADTATYDLVDPGDNQGVYQVDTGPVVYPDLSQRYDPTEEGLSLAFVAFNTRDRADFILDVPTPVTDPSERLVAEVHHYSKRMTVLATNRVFAI